MIKLQQLLIGILSIFLIYYFLINQNLIEGKKKTEGKSLYGNCESVFDKVGDSCDGFPFAGAECIVNANDHHLYCDFFR